MMRNLILYLSGCGPTGRPWLDSAWEDEPAWRHESARQMAATLSGGATVYQVKIEVPGEVVAWLRQGPIVEREPLFAGPVGPAVNDPDNVSQR